ncbi:hypothetical protein [Streptomyces cinereoruber]|uniref:hypothetical protein n=1 Tax=Streptomyces cinereoruber TaxID=67260 RepID=UPI0036315F92
MSAATVEPLTDPSGAEVMASLVARSGPGQEPAVDMEDLAEALRALLGVEAGCDTRVRLGGNLFDVVITGSGAQAHAAVAAMDKIQGGCGPVIEDPANGWLYWLVPPGSTAKWEPHPYAVCLGAPHSITLPPLERTAPPGPYWLRPSASDRLVPAGPLWGLLAQLRPDPTPHELLAARLGIHR